VAAFSHGGESGPPELSVHPIAEGVVPGGVAGFASEACRLGEVGSSAVEPVDAGVGRWQVAGGGW
jgi:hypothetical protein